MSTKLPDAVQRQLDEAEALEASLTQPAPAPEPEPPAPEPPPAPPVPEPPTEDWKQKYLTLQGKYNAEVPQLRSELNELKQQIKDLAKPAPAPATAPEPAPVTKLLTDKDADTFGADLIDLIQRAAREEGATAKAALEAEIAALKAQLPTLTTKVDDMAATQGTDRREKYYAGLAAAVSDYVEINADPAFLSWLEGVDAMTGVTKNDLLQDAFAQFNVPRTAAVFNAYKAETTPPTPPVTVEPEPKPPGLEREISPGNSKTSSPADASDPKKIWTSKEVENFYNGVTRGDFKGREAEAKATEAQIDQALAEGRVTL